VAGSGANWGVEGATDDPEILATRKRVTRSMLATLFTALGTPMLTAGDEFGRTQGGNNNAYCQDNEISWLDWHAAQTDEGQALVAFVAKLVALRKRHPLLRSTHFLRGVDDVMPGMTDVGWFDERGETLTDEAWHDPEGRALTLRRAGKGMTGEIDVLLLMLNGGPTPLDFIPPAPRLEWNVLIDSTEPDEPPHRLEGDSLVLGEHGFAVLYARPSDATAAPTRDDGTAAVNIHR
jgi:glycogen operon protein